MSASIAEVARRALRVRGLLEHAEPIQITGGRAVAEYREAFVGIDVATLRNAIELAKASRTHIESLGNSASECDFRHSATMSWKLRERPIAAINMVAEVAD